MVMNLKKSGVLLVMGVALASCGQKKSAKDKSSPPEFLMGETISKKLDNGKEVVSQLVGTCRQDLGESRQRQIGVYRRVDEPSIGLIDITDVEIKQSQNGYSVSYTPVDSADNLKIEENAGIITVTTTPESKSLAQPSKLDLSPEGTVILMLNPFGAEDGEVLRTPVKLKGLVEGDMICKKR
jgi:hypothetical protein